MSQENVNKMRDFIDAYNRRDFDAAVEDFDPQIDWVLPTMQATTWPFGFATTGGARKAARK